MLKKLLGSVLLCLCLNAQASDQWTTEQKALGLTALALAVADWGQTLDIANHPGIYETNPILGRHPSRKAINIYFPLAIGAGYLLADYSGQYRTYALGLFVGIQATNVGRNYQLGLRMGF